MDKLNVGDILYNAKRLHQKFEVIRETKSVYCIAVLNGSASTVEYVSKGASLEKFKQEWFFTEKEAIASKVAKLEKEAKYLKEQYLQDDNNLTDCCGAKHGLHKNEYVCFCCGMPYKK